MKRITRAQLRWQPLDALCRMAHTTTNEYGPDDKRVFCYGLIDATNDEPDRLCAMCGAFIRNMTPPKEE